MNREISIQKQKKCFQLITFEVKNIHGAFSKKVNEDPFWKKIRVEKVSWKKNRYTFQKKFKTLLKKK